MLLESAENGYEKHGVYRCLNRQATDRSFKQNISVLLSSSIYLQYCALTGIVFFNAT